MDKAALPFDVKLFSRNFLAHNFHRLPAEWIRSPGRRQNSGKYVQRRGIEKVDVKYSPENLMSFSPMGPRWWHHWWHGERTRLGEEIRLISFRVGKLFLATNQKPKNPLYLVRLFLCCKLEEKTIILHSMEHNFCAANQQSACETKFMFKTNGNHYSCWLIIIKRT